MAHTTQCVLQSPRRRPGSLARSSKLKSLKLGFHQTGGEDSSKTLPHQRRVNTQHRQAQALSVRTGNAHSSQHTHGSWQEGSGKSFGPSCHAPQPGLRLHRTPRAPQLCFHLLSRVGFLSSELSHSSTACQRQQCSGSCRLLTAQLAKTGGRVLVYRHHTHHKERMCRNALRITETPSVVA